MRVKVKIKENFEMSDMVRRVLRFDHCSRTGRNGLSARVNTGVFDQILIGLEVFCNLLTLSEAVQHWAFATKLSL